MNAEKRTIVTMWTRIGMALAMLTLPYVNARAATPRIIDDKGILSALEQNGSDMVRELDKDFAESVSEQLTRRTCELELPDLETREADSPAGIYERSVASVLVVGVFYHCASSSCKRLHNSTASGVLIREDVFVTNYHVIDRGKSKLQGVVVMTVDGELFPADGILAADPDRDIAILSLRNATGLLPAPLHEDEPVGNPVTVISHPKKNFFSLATGHVSRYTLDDSEQVVMQITADYAIGSSGAPVFNRRGAIVGVVSSTSSIAAARTRFGVDPETGNLMVGSGRNRRRKGTSEPQADRKEEQQDERSGERREAGAPEAEEDEEDEDEDDTPIVPAHGRRSVYLPLHHQMTIKNTVPARAIREMITQASAPTFRPASARYKIDDYLEPGRDEDDGR